MSQGERSEVRGEIHPCARSKKGRAALEWDRHFMGRLRCPRPKAYAGHCGAGKMLLGFLRGAVCYIADPEPRLEAATLIEAMRARVFPTVIASILGIFWPSSFSTH